MGRPDLNPTPGWDKTETITRLVTAPARLAAHIRYQRTGSRGTIEPSTAISNPNVIDHITT